MKREYMVPTVEVLTTRIECGYSGSSGTVENFNITSTDQGGKFRFN